MVKKQKYPREKNNPNKEPAYYSYVKYSGLGFQSGIIIAVFTYGGYKVDEWLNTSFPIFLAIGLLLGIALGIYLMIKDFIKKQ